MDDLLCQEELSKKTNAELLVLYNIKGDAANA